MSEEIMLNHLRTAAERVLRRRRARFESASCMRTKGTQRTKNMEWMVKRGGGCSCGGAAVAEEEGGMLGGRGRGGRGRSITALIMCRASAVLPIEFQEKSVNKRK